MFISNKKREPRGVILYTDYVSIGGNVYVMFLQTKETKMSHISFQIKICKKKPVGFPNVLLSGETFYGKALLKIRITDFYWPLPVYFDVIIIIKTQNSILPLCICRLCGYRTQPQNLSALYPVVSGYHWQCLDRKM